MPAKLMGVLRRRPGAPAAGDVLPFALPAGEAPAGRLGHVWWQRAVIWDRADVQRRKDWGGYDLKNQGLVHFFESAEAFEWTFFVVMLCIFLYISGNLMDWPSRKKGHAAALLIWLGAACFYNFIVWGRLGREVGQEWLTGYILELIFSMENIFIYHIVVQAFGMPDKQSVNALMIVMCFQMIFQMVFFMGLADLLNSIWVLPYVLGAWLLYVGYGTLQDEHHQFAPEDSTVFRALRVCFGKRLSQEFREDARIFYVEDGISKISLLGPATLCLLLVDFVMEIDVTLTKIEEIPNHYIAFTSSVAATFAIPELFFVARDLFRRFALLRYGISCVLFLFGAELLLTQVLVVYEMINVLIITAIMLLCIGLSQCLGSTTEAKTAPPPAEARLGEVH